MAIKVLCILFCAAAASAVQIPYPSAVSYVYRNDNSGPGYGQLNQAAPYLLPQNFPAPIPIQLASPVPRYRHISPEPLHELPSLSIAEDIEDDNEELNQSYQGVTPAKFVDHGHAEGGGSNYGEEYVTAHGEKEGKGHKSEGHHDEGTVGSYSKEHHEGYSDNSKGEKKAHHDEAAEHGKHFKTGKNYKGGDHGHKKHYSKGEDTTGYHKVFHKDEFKKDHDFYDYADNKGHFGKHGSQEGHHATEKGGHKEGGRHESASDKEDHGKAGFHKKSHVDDAEEAHSFEEGHDDHYNDEAEYGKKEDNSREKTYGFHDADEHDYD